MKKEELQKEAIYNIKVETLQTVLPLNKEIIENKIMPVFYDIFAVYLDIDGYIQKTIERLNRPIVVKSDKFLTDKFVEKVCKWIEENTQTINDGATHYVASKNKVTQEEFVKSLKEEFSNLTKE